MSSEVPPSSRILNCEPSRETQRDWRFEHAASAGILAATTPVPAAKDLREDWWEIGDQGETGSCVGWASAAAVFRWHFVKASRLPQTSHLSVRFVWMASKETDADRTAPTTMIESAGTTLKAALDVGRRFGAVQDSILPFATGQLYVGDDKTFYAIAAQLKITSYFNLGTNDGQWRTWLATRGPILTRLDVDRTWDEVSNTGNLDQYQPATVRGGHAVALVGYTAARFIVRNSWGTGWGDQGFAYASIPYAQAAFTEAYGVIA